jgi:nicotinate-nucleotide adenylyltransferase
MRRAIFGGTFDPIHNAHIAIARQAADSFALDQVLMIPAAQPPHKGTWAPYEHRYRMVELACAVDPRLVPSRMEEGQTKSYSIQTIERLKADGGELFFVIGGDAFAEIQTWYRAPDVIRAVEFIVAARPGHPYETPPGACVHRLDCLDLPVSSSKIRAQLVRGERPPELPAPVADYIAAVGLYREL